MAVGQHRIVLVNEYVSRGLGTMSSGATGATVANDKLNKSMGDTNKKSKDFLAQFTRMRWAIVNVALATGVAYGAFNLLLKPAIDLETAMIGVRKTTGMAAEELLELRRAFVEISKSTSISAEEFANIGTIAGQLGIRGVKNITEFSKVVSEMGIATVLSTEEAAIGLARLSAIMREPITNSRKMASAMVALGNTVAADEKQILEMALRLAGAGKVIGLSTDEVLGFAASLAELGIKAQSGGTSFSRLFLEMQTAISRGGKELKTFAEISGMTIDDFVKLYQTDASDAIVTFVEGLGNLNKASKIDALKILGLDTIRVRDALLRTSSASEQLRTNMDLANQSSREGIAVGAEHDAALDSTIGLWGILVNRIKSAVLENETMLKLSLEGVVQAGTINQLRDETIKLMVAEQASREELNELQQTTQDLIVSGLPFLEAQAQAIAFLKDKQAELNKENEDEVVALIRKAEAEKKAKEEAELSKDIIQDHRDKLQELNDKKMETILLGIEQGRTEDYIREELKKLDEEYAESIKVQELFSDSLKKTQTPADDLKNKLKDLSETGVKKFKDASGKLVDIKDKLEEIKERSKNVKESFKEEFSGEDSVNSSIEDTNVELTETDKILKGIEEVGLDKPIEGFTKLADKAEQLSRTGIAQKLIALEELRIQAPIRLAQIEADREVKLAKIKAEEADDFVARPGQPIIKFNPQDTIIGMKEPGKLTGRNNVQASIIIQGYNKNAKELAIEVKRQISSLA